MIKFKHFAYCILVLSGCDSSTNLSTKDHSLNSETQHQELPENTQTPQVGIDSTPQIKIVARLAGKPVSMADIDTGIKLRLFDLEWRKYELRRTALNAKIDTHLLHNENLNKRPEESVEVYLTPPKPPRIQFPKSKRQVKGNPDAKVTLAVFCSYQSSHCARLQPVIHALEEQYKGAINFSFYDFPQSFHRYAMSAANAVHCATEFTAPWQFQSAIYADISQLNAERYLTIANQLGFDKTAFSNCINAFKYKHQIEADISFGQQLGLGNVPILFINGLYAKGPQTVAGFSYYIDEELSRLNTVNSAKKPVITQLPIRLLATYVSNRAEESTAIVHDLETDQIHTFKVDEHLSDNIKLVSIEETRIQIDHKGQLQFIFLKDGLGSQAQTSSDDATTEIIASEPINIETRGPLLSNEAKTTKKHRELKQGGEMSLSSTWIEAQLSQRGELEKFFYAAEHEVEGVHLLKLNDIDKQEFYKTLGLQSGDVILRVNEEFVHDAHNPLWDALQNESAIKLLVMRKGYPVRYDYKIK